MADQSETVSNVARKAFASSSNYENIRHDYPFEAVKFLLRKLGVRDNDPTDISASGTDRPPGDRPFTILEVGCGTGKFTRVMLEVLKGKNVKVIASEPLQSMLEQFRLMVPDTEIIQCPAEKIPLPDASVDAVIAAQSFHWFTNRAALEEIHRVLAPNGSLGIVWTLADMSIPWLKELFEFIDRLDKENALVFPLFEEWSKVFSDLSQHLFSAPEKYVGFEYSMTSSFDHAFNLFSSYSIIAGGSERNKKDFHDVFNEVTKKHFKDKGIPLDAIQFNIHMNWCVKEN